MIYQAKIEKEVVLEFPVVKTNCEIVVIETPQEVDVAVQELYLSDIVGFDTETKPSFICGKINKIALLQLSTEKKCYLFRLQKIGKNEALKTFLESTKILKIGLSTKDDFRMLNKWMNVKPQNFVDLQSFVKEFGIEELACKKYSQSFFRKEFPNTSNFQTGRRKR